MIKSEGMRKLIEEECYKRCVEFDWDLYEVITDTIKHELEKPGTIMVEGEFSICPPWMVEKVKEILG